ncbi:MAG: hypothetical protein JWO41_349 [Candidatus Saccharibacteria bacterium]|nr:hypothetical protein [Candidatus Saccharibacteria bacterium]
MYPAKHFSLSLPRGEGQDNIPELLKQLAKELEAVDGMEVMDIVFRNEIDEDGVDWPSFTVYLNDLRQ